MIKSCLEFGGPHAARGAFLLPALPEDSLADLIGPMKDLINPYTGLANDDIAPYVKYYLDKGEAAREKRGEGGKQEEWDAWCEFAGKSSVAWPAPPDDSVYAYPKLEAVENPKKPPDGWQWLLVPAQRTGYLEAVARWKV